MNGVRRFLGAATAPPPAQLDLLPPASAVPSIFSPKAGPTWPPSPDSPEEIPSAITSPATASNLLKRPIYENSDSKNSSNSFGLNNGQSPPPPAGRKGVAAMNLSKNYRATSISPSSPGSVPSSAWKRLSENLNTRDDLLLSLMASEAVIDSRDFDILSSEEVEDLKKEYQDLSSKLTAVSKKLTTDTKIRDAALSLSKVNPSQKAISKQTSDQLETTNRRVETTQAEFWKLSDRTNEVHRKLMEHRASVLSVSVRNLEKKLAPAADDSGYDSSNRSTMLSAPSSSSFASSTNTKFDGAHLFAGHADAIVPKRKLNAEQASAEIAALEEKLNSAKDSLAAARKKQAEMTRELSMMKLEKQEVETVMGMDLQAAQESVAAFEKDIPRLEEAGREAKMLRQEKVAWEREQRELQEKIKQTEILQSRILDLETQSGRAAGGADRALADLRKKSELELEERDLEIERLKDELASTQSAWVEERRVMEDEKLDDVARLQEEIDQMRDEYNEAGNLSQEELKSGLATLQVMVKTHGIVLFTRDNSLRGLLDAVGMHVDSVHTRLESYAKAEAEWDVLRRKLEDDVRNGLDKREEMAKELEEARRERDSARSSLSMPVKPRSRTPGSQVASDEGDMDNVGHVYSILQPIWAILPSPEARAAKFATNTTTQRSFRSGSPPVVGGSTNGVTSLSDLDVRSLKSLYDPRIPSSPAPSKFGAASSPFSIESFAARVQALINDDRALIERLVRFAQAHDLLKKNAERAQKLASDGNSALETYQKQVRTLEERNMSMASKQAVLQEETQMLQSTIDRITAEKRELEKLSAEQAQTCRELSEANSTLTARTLSLAEEAAQAPEMMRKQLEGQLTELKRSLQIAQDEVDAMRTSEQSQRIALLDELNSMQTENGNLRAQLRAFKK